MEASRKYFPQPGDADWLQTVNREVAATRNGVGICDVSTLGKIDVQGPDAGVLLDRLYINMFSTLPVGKARYGVMLREDGLVMDDGTTTRFADDRFFVTTTTVNAAKVMQHIDYARQVLWPELDVQATSVTEQWSHLFGRRGLFRGRCCRRRSTTSTSLTKPSPSWRPSSSPGEASRRGCSGSPSPGNWPMR